MQDVEQVLEGLIAAKFNVPDGGLRPETDLVGDLGADSLDVVELLMAVEDTLGVRIEDAEAESIRTFGDAVRVARAKVARAIPAT